MFNFLKILRPTNKVRAIICIGFGKSATTTLHAFFQKLPDALVPVHKKELNYFLQPPVSLADYLGHFGPAAEVGDFSSRVLFEASPMYATGGQLGRLRQVLRRIQTLLPDALIVLNMRHPLRRAYSHYLHNLQQFALWGDRAWRPLPGQGLLRILREPFAASFEEALGKYPNLNPSYAGTIAQIFEIFGPDRLLPFFFERDVAAFPAWLRQASGRIGLDLLRSGPGNLPWELEGAPMPAYRYAPRAIEIPLGEALLRLAPHELLICTGRAEQARLRVIEGVAAEVGARLEAAQASWTRGVTADDAARLTRDFFGPDLRAASTLMRRHGFDDTLIENYLAPPGAYKLELREHSILDRVSPAAMASLERVAAVPVVPSLAGAPRA